MSDSVTRSDVAIAIDLGGTKCAAALIDREGTAMSHASIQYGADSPDAVAQIILELAERLHEQADSRKIGIAGIGVSVPGIVHLKKGTVWAPNIRGWEEYPLKEYLNNDPSLQGLKVYLESDRGCSIMGECWKGAAKGAMNAVFLAVGTGIGAGILVDGEVVRGTGDIAGAAGWMALQRPYHDKLKPYGYFEYYASGDGLVRAAREIADENGPSELLSRGLKGTLTGEALFDAYERDEPVARKVMDQAIELWGMASANLVSLFNPEIIIFGGGVFGPATRFLERIRHEASRWAQPIAIRQVRFLPSLLQGRAPLYGAAYRVFSDQKTT